MFPLSIRKQLTASFLNNKKRKSKVKAEKRQPLTCEHLESRITPIITPGMAPYAVDPRSVIAGGDNLNGVVQITTPNGAISTGTLIDVGFTQGSRHVLTNANAFRAGEVMDIVVTTNAVFPAFDSFTLTMNSGGQSTSTAPIFVDDLNVSALQPVIQQAVRSLSNVGNNQFFVSGPNTIGPNSVFYRVQFAGTFNGVNLPNNAFTATSNNPGTTAVQAVPVSDGYDFTTAASPTPATVNFYLPRDLPLVGGNPNDLNIQTISYSIPLSNLFVNPAWQGVIGFGSGTDNPDWAILTLPTIAPFGASDYQLNFDPNELSLAYSMSGYGLVGDSIAPPVANTNEFQRITVVPPPNNGTGTFTLSLNAGTTAPIQWNANPNQLALNIKNALQTLPGITLVNVRPVNNQNVLPSVSQPDTGTFQVEFAGPANTNLPQMTANSAGLNGGNVTIRTIQNGTLRAQEYAANSVAIVNAGNFISGALPAGPNTRPGIAAVGDFGGPALYDFGNGNLALLGVASYNGGIVPQYGLTATTTYTRVSEFASQITIAATASPYVLNVDLNQQVVGNDGVEDTIEVYQQFGLLIVKVNGKVYYSDDISNISGVNIQGSSDNDHFKVQAHLSIPVFVEGNLGINTFQGDDVDSRYFIGGVDVNGRAVGQYDDNELPVNDTNVFFGGINNFVGGTANDSFRFFSAGPLNGSVDGGNGIDELTFPFLPAQTVTLTGVGFINGFDGTVAPIGGGFFNIDGFQGSGNLTDTLVGLTTPALWTVDGVDAGVFTDQVSGHSFRFSDTENLTGGGSTDKFLILPNSSISGNIDGGGGTADRLSFESYNHEITLNLTSAATGTGSVQDVVINSSVVSSFSNIEEAVGTASTDTLVGNETIFDLDGADFGRVNAVFTFFAFGNIDDSAGVTATVVNINPGGSLSGLLTASAQAGTVINNLTGLAHTFTISSPNAGGTSSIHAFKNVRNLVGGANVNDTFRFLPGGSVAGDISGGVGIEDVLDYSAFDASSTVDLETLTATGIGGNFAGIDRYIGATNRIDTLVGPVAANLWVVTGVNTGDVNGFKFAGVENLTGNTDVDTFIIDLDGRVTGVISGNGGNDLLDDETARAATFTFDGVNTGKSDKVGFFVDVENFNGTIEDDKFIFKFGSSVTGEIAGFEGNDVMDFSDLTSQNVVLTGLSLFGGFEGTAGPIGGVFFDMEGVIGSAAGTGDTLTGDDVNSIWEVTAKNAGTYLDVGAGIGFSFSNTENLIGSTQADTFHIRNGGYLTGSLNGGAGNNILQGSDVASIFRITGANSGSYNEINVPLPGNVFAWSNIQDLVGGTGDDRFIFGAAGSVAGDINGGGGLDTLDFSALAAQDVTITGPGAIDGFDGFTPGVAPIGGVFLNINNIINSNAGGGGIIGFATNAAWDIYLVNGGTYTDLATGQSVMFTNTPNLTGNTGIDTFRFRPNGRITGNIDGDGGPEDRITFEDFDLEVTATITSATAGTGTVVQSVSNLPLVSSFSNIEEMTGSRFVDTLVGTETVFDLDSADAGRINGVFSFFAFGNIDDSAGVTATVVNINPTGSLSGTLTASAQAGTVINNLTGKANTFTISGANSGSATWIHAFKNVRNLVGGSANDTFRFLPGGSLAGNIDGDGGVEDSLDFSAFDASVSLAMTTQTSGTVTAVGGTYTSITRLIGSGRIDTLTGVAGGNVFSLNDKDKGVVNTTFKFEGVENLTGSAVADSFILSPNGRSTGTLNGLGGSDTLTDATNTAATFTVTGADSGLSDKVQTFSSIENLVSGALDDKFIFKVAGQLTGSITAGAGDDILDFSDQVSHAVALTASTANGYTGTVSVITGGFTEIDGVVGSAAGTTDSLTGTANNSRWEVTSRNGGFYLDITTGVDFTFANTENLIGGANGDTFLIRNGGSLTGSIDGAAGVNRLQGNDLPGIFRVTGTNSGQYNDNNVPNATNFFTFSNVGNLDGGTANDIFRFEGAGNVTGDINGGAGVDLLDVFNRAVAHSVVLSGPGLIDGINGTATASVGGVFRNLEGVAGSTLGDSLTGYFTDALWTVNGRDSGSYKDLSNGRTFSFANVETLTGNAGQDTFRFLNDGRITTAINGAGGAQDRLTFAEQDLEINLDLTSIATGTGSVAQAITGVVLVSSFSNIEEGTGSARQDILRTHETTYEIDGVDSGRATAGGAAWTFFSFSNLDDTAGTTATTVNINPLGSLTGTVTGNGLAGTVINNNTGKAHLFEVTGLNSGRTTAIASFVNIRNLNGGTTTDTFRFHPGGQLSGSIDGKGGGANLLDYSQFDAPVLTKMTTNSSGTSTNIGGTYSNVQRLIGSARPDELVGLAAGNTWSLTNVDTGVVNGAFQFEGMENLTGSDTAADTFLVGPLGRSNGTLTGNSGTGVGAGDTLTDNSNTDNRFTLNGQNRGSSDSINRFVGIEFINGSTKTDVLAFDVGGSLSGKFDGREGYDQLDYSTFGGQVQTKLTTINSGRSTGFTLAAGDQFLNTEGVIGSRRAGPVTGDILTGLATATRYTVHGTDSGYVATEGDASASFTFDAVENLVGQGGNDVFETLNGGYLSGSANGGAGRNSIDDNSGNDNWFRVDGVNSGSTSKLRAFSNVQDLVGDTGRDVFNFGLRGRLEVVAGTPGTVTGEGWKDEINFSAFQRTVTTTLTTAFSGRSVESQAGGAIIVDFFQIEGEVGSVGRDTLIAQPGQSHEIFLTGFDAGHLNNEFTFDAVENITGNTFADTFTIDPNGSTTGTLDGAGGNDVLDAHTFGNTTFTIKQQNLGHTDTVNQWQNIENLRGHNGNDVFKFVALGGVDGFINGEDGVDTMDYTLARRVVVTNLFGINDPTATDTGSFGDTTGVGPTAGGGGFQNMESSVGSKFGDTLLGYPTNNDWKITGLGTGTINEFFAFGAYENLTGKNGRDVFHFGPNGSIGGTLNGGGSPAGTGDWIDYSQVRSGVRVNLAANVASRLKRVIGIENLIGSYGGGDLLIGNNVANVIVGQGNNNSIQGLAGNDFIIGGQGRTRILGGLGEDLLIAGFTDYDLNVIALDALQNVWAFGSAGAAYAARVAALQSGVGVAGGVFLRVNETVHFAPDAGPRLGLGGAFRNYTTVGNEGRDLFFARWSNVITDRNSATETLIQI